METVTDAEIASLVERWRQSTVAKDVDAAAALRDETYSLRLPSGEVLSRPQELEALTSGAHRIDSYRIDNLRIERKDGRATAVFDCTLEGVFRGRPATVVHQTTIVFAHRGGAWKAVESRVEEAKVNDRAPTETIRARSRRWLRRVTSKPTASFQDLAYIPHRSGEDFVLPKSAEPPYQPGAPLPIPPPELWLGYHYPAHGKMHVDRMLEIAGQSGFAFRPGDRILDFGCGAGRMIRHLQPLAETCEIWGTDISATHILWCKRNLSPPFRFATTTKVPHLPFEDRSFRFIYCGSVFTHIDDMADAWLLELRRILEPDGRLYVTIHDNHTLALLESGQAGWLDSIRKTRAYRQAKDSFDMFTVGRDDTSQVFYDQAYFRRMAGSAFEVLSVTPEAYFYQTALLLKRR